MTRVLFIAYFFPPIGGSGVQRTVKFMRYLPELGLSSSAIASPLGSTGQGLSSDETLAGELPPGTQVWRVAGPEPEQPGRWRGRAERWARLRSAWSSWWVDGVVEAGVEPVGFDAIVATGSPFESFEAAAAIARRQGVPWIADLRDPWALDEMRIYPSAIHRRLELKRMEGALGLADAIVMNTEEAARALLEAFPRFEHKRVVAIPNGYDRSDFSGTVEPPADGAFRITHVGSLHTTQGTEHRRNGPMRRALGGMLGDVDILARSHVYLLEAVERLAAESPDLGPIEVHLAGDLSPEDRAAIQGDAVRLHGYVDHPRSVELMRSADLLFLPMHDLPTAQRARIVPGKTYEYVAAGRPVLAAVPDGDARDLIEQLPNSYVCRPRDVDGMIQAIRTEILRKRTGETRPGADPALLERYERRVLTARLVELVGAVIEAADRR